MGCSVYVTEYVVTRYEFDSEEEAREFLDRGDIWILDGDVIDGEVLEVDVVPDNC